jgi:hypothetical protein
MRKTIVIAALLLTAAQAQAAAVIDKSWVGSLKARTGSTIDTAVVFCADKSDSLKLLFSKTGHYWWLQDDSAGFIIKDTGWATEGEVKDSLARYFDKSKYDGITIDTSSSGQLQVKQAGIGSYHIANQSVDSMDIKNGAVTREKLAATAFDSTKAPDDALSPDDINWRYEWLYLTIVHGRNRATQDSIYLSFPVESPNGDSTWLFTDSAGTVAANDQDTVNVSGYVPFACTIDSLEYAYEISSGSKIDTISLKGRKPSSTVNLTDSTYYGNGADRSSTSWTVAGYAITAFGATAGDRFSWRGIINFGGSNQRLHFGWVRMRVKQ